MGTISDKLDYLKDTKSQIKEALIAKHATVSDTDTFRSYADKIKTIPQVDATLIKKTIIENGTYIATSEKDVTKCDGYSEVTVAVRGATDGLTSVTYIENGTYKATDDKSLNQMVVNGAYKDASPVEYSGNLKGVKFSSITLKSSKLYHKGTVTIALQKTSGGAYTTVATVEASNTAFSGSDGGNITLDYMLDLKAETPIYGYKITFTGVYRVSCTITFKSTSQVYYGYNQVTVDVRTLLVNPEDATIIIPATLTVQGYDPPTT